MDANNPNIGSIGLYGTHFAIPNSQNKADVTDVDRLRNVEAALQQVLITVKKKMITDYCRVAEVTHAVGQCLIQANNFVDENTDFDMADVENILMEFMNGNDRLEPNLLPALMSGPRGRLEAYTEQLVPIPEMVLQSLERTVSGTIDSVKFNHSVLKAKRNLEAIKLAVAEGRCSFEDDDHTGTLILAMCFTN